MPRSRPACIAAFVAVFATAVCLLPGTTRAADEATLKAGFLYNFARFVSWPSSAFKGPRAPIVIGIIGDDPIGQVLDGAVKGRKVRGRAASVERFPSGTEPDALKHCHILLVSRSESARSNELVDGLSGSSVLTVGDDEGFAKQGGMLSFRLENSRLALDLNLDATRKSRLEVSAQLKQVARIVKTER